MNEFFLTHLSIYNNSTLTDSTNTFLLNLVTEYIVSAKGFDNLLILYRNPFLQTICTFNLNSRFFFQYNLFLFLGVLFIFSLNTNCDNSQSLSYLDIFFDFLLYIIIMFICLQILYMLVFCLNVYMFLYIVFIYFFIYVFIYAYIFCL